MVIYCNNICNAILSNTECISSPRAIKVYTVITKYIQNKISRHLLAAMSQKYHNYKAFRGRFISQNTKFVPAMRKTTFNILRRRDYFAAHSAAIMHKCRQCIICAPHRRFVALLHIIYDSLIHFHWDYFFVFLLILDTYVSNAWWYWLRFRALICEAISWWWVSKLFSGKYFKIHIEQWWYRRHSEH